MTSYLTKIETNHEKFSFKPEGKIFPSKHSKAPLSGRTMDVDGLKINELKTQCSFYFINLDTGNTADSDLFGSSGYGTVNEVDGVFIQNLVGFTGSVYFTASRHTDGMGGWTPLIANTDYSKPPQILTELEGDFKVEGTDKFISVGKNNPNKEQATGSFNNASVGFKKFKGKLYTAWTSQYGSWHYINSDTLVQDPTEDSVIAGFMNGKLANSFMPHSQGFITADESPTKWRIYDNDLNLINDLPLQPSNIDSLVEYDGFLYALMFHEIKQLDPVTGEPTGVVHSNLLNFRVNKDSPTEIFGNIVLYQNYERAAGRDNSLSLLNLETMSITIDIDPELFTNAYVRYFLDESRTSLIYSNGLEITRTPINIETVKTLTAPRAGLLATKGDVIKFNNETITINDSLGANKLDITSTIGFTNYTGKLVREPSEGDYVTTAKDSNGENLLVIRKMVNNKTLVGLEVETKVKEGFQLFKDLQSSKPEDAGFVGASGSSITHSTGTKIIQNLNGSLSDGKSFEASRDSLDNGVTWTVLTKVVTESTTVEALPGFFDKNVDWNIGAGPTPVIANEKPDVKGLVDAASVDPSFGEILGSGYNAFIPNSSYFELTVKNYDSENVYILMGGPNWEDLTIGPTSGDLLNISLDAPDHKSVSASNGKTLPEEFPIAGDGTDITIAVEVLVNGDVFLTIGAKRAKCFTQTEPSKLVVLAANTDDVNAQKITVELIDKPLTIPTVSGEELLRLADNPGFILADSIPKVLSKSPSIMVGEDENGSVTIESLTDKVNPSFTWSVKGEDEIYGYPGILWDENDTPNSRGLFTVNDYKFSSSVTIAEGEVINYGHPMGVFDARLVKGTKVAVTMKGLSASGLEQNFVLTSGDTKDLSLASDGSYIVVLIKREHTGKFWAEPVNSTDATPISELNPLDASTVDDVTFYLEYATDGIIYLHYKNVRHMLVNDPVGEDRSYLIGTYVAGIETPLSSETFLDVDTTYSTNMDPAVVPLSQSTNVLFARDKELNYVNRVVSSSKLLEVKEGAKGTLEIDLKEKPVKGVDSVAVNQHLTKDKATSITEDGYILVDKSMSYMESIPLDTEFYGDFNFEFSVPKNTEYTSGTVKVEYDGVGFSAVYNGDDISVTTRGLTTNINEVISTVNNRNEDFTAIISGQWLDSKTLIMGVDLPDGKSSRTIIPFPVDMGKKILVTLLIGEIV